MLVDSHTLQSTPESGHRAGYGGYQRRKGAKIHAAVDSLGQLIALHFTPADVDQSYTGDAPQQAAADHGMALEMVKMSQAKRGFVLLPRR